MSDAVTPSTPIPATADDPMSEKEESDSESSVIELPSEPSLTTALRPGFPRFMPPVDLTRQYYSQSPRATRDPSAEIPRPYPQIPTQPIPASSTRSRSKSWVAVAARSVDVFRSKNSMNYSKRTPYKSNSKNALTPATYRLVSVTGPEDPCTPCPKNSEASATVETPPSTCQKSITPCSIDKDLPSEKPLPSTPDTKPDEDILSSESRTIIDAKEVPLHRSPPDKPNVKEEWPILSPLKTCGKKDNGGQVHETKLTTIEEEMSSAASSGVRMFSDAVTKLSIVSNNITDEVNQPCAETKADNYDNEGSAYTVTRCHTLNPNNTCLPPTSLSSSVTSITSEPLAVTTAPLSQPKSPVTNCHTGTTTMDTPSNIPKTNPFRKRPRVSSSPNSATKPPRMEKRALSCTFDATTDTGQSSTDPYPDSTNGTTASSATAFDADRNAQDTPRHQKSMSKIPRISPMASHFNAEDNGGSGMKPFTASGGRSGIPVPSRMLYKSKGGPFGWSNPFNPFDDSEKRSSGSIGRCKQPSEFDAHATSNGVSEGTDEPANQVTVRQLSTTAPSHGPKLRISPDAERVIMGDGGDGSESENNLKENRKSGRQLGHRREFRLSADSLFGNFGPKRGRNSGSRLSFTSELEPEPSPLAGKTISKAKSAELGAGRYAPSQYRTRSRTSPENETHNPPGNKHGTNPFFNNEPVPNLPSPAPCNMGGLKEEQEQVLSDPQVRETKNEESTGSDNDEVVATATVLQPEKIENASPSKPKRPAERSSPRKTNETLKKETPKSPRSHRNTARVSPRKSPHQPSARQVNHRKSKSNRESETASGSASVQQTVATDQKEKQLVIQKRHGQRSEDHTGTIQAVKYKGSTTRGVLSNFRGLFTKNKLEATKEDGSPSLPRPKRKSGSRFKPHSNATNSEVNVSGVPANDGQHTNMDIACISSGHADSPALTDTGRISHLTMEILDSARREMDTSRKEKLIKLGKILIEAVNHSHDAEKAMLTAIQAAKEAEVACALAKENAMKMGQVALEWTQGHNRYEQLL